MLNRALFLSSANRNLLIEAGSWGPCRMPLIRVETIMTSSSSLLLSRLLELTSKDDDAFSVAWWWCRSLSPTMAAWSTLSETWSMWMHHTCIVLLPTLYRGLCPTVTNNHNHQHHHCWFFWPGTLPNKNVTAQLKKLTDRAKIDWSLRFLLILLDIHRIYTMNISYRVRSIVLFFIW